MALHAADAALNLFQGSRSAVAAHEAYQQGNYGSAVMSGVGAVLGFSAAGTRALQATGQWCFVADTPVVRHVDSDFVAIAMLQGLPPEQDDEQSAALVWLAGGMAAVVLGRSFTPKRQKKGDGKLLEGIHRCIEQNDWTRLLPWSGESFGRGSETVLTAEDWNIVCDRLLMET